jgi:hypothetical protein
MEGSARGDPFCKEIFFLFLEKKGKNRENGEKRRSRDSIAVRDSAHL